MTGSNNPRIRALCPLVVSGLRLLRRIKMRPPFGWDGVNFDNGSEADWMRDPVITRKCYKAFIAWAETFLYP